MWLQNPMSFSNKDFLVIWCYHRWVALLFGRSIWRSDPIIRSTQPHLEDGRRRLRHPSINGVATNQPTVSHLCLKKNGDGKGFTVFLCPKKNWRVISFSQNSLFCDYLIPEDVWHDATLSAGSCTTSTHSYISCFAVFNELRSIPCNPTPRKTPLFPAPKTPVRNDGLQIGEGWQCRERIGDIQDHAVPCEAIASLEKWRGKRRTATRGRTKKKCSREKKHKKSVWLAYVLQRWSCCLFLEWLY